TLSNDLSTPALMAFINAALYQTGFVFGFHLVAALYTNRIHKCCARLCQISAREKGLQRMLGPQLKLANYIQKFHANKRYGITYMGYGLVTFRSFFKVNDSVLLRDRSHIT